MLGHGQQFKGASASWDGFQKRIRNPSLTLILVLELSMIFFSAPLAAKGLPLAEKILDVSTWTMVVLIVLLSHRWGAIVSIALALVLFSADLSQIWLPVAPSVLGHIGRILGLGALTWVVMHAVFAPGRITYQRVQGAIVAYLNLALIFASAYRLIWELSPAAFNYALGARGGPGDLGTLLYFSLTTLTTTGYGDITPVDPFARSAANLEAVIGQFYLAITIARLVALEIADRRG
jgi:Ion channel